MKQLKKKKWGMLFLVLLVCLIILRVGSPPLRNPPIVQDIAAPPEVEQVLRKSCYDCHSNETKPKWFDQVPPASWLVASHVEAGRKALNFSEWNKLAAGEQKGKLFLSLNDILTQQMPLPSYLLLHPEARLTQGDIGVLKKYLLTLSPRKPTISQTKEPSSNWMHQAGSPARAVKPAPNGIEFIRDYPNWKAISTTDRFDNETMRVIYGNEVAIKAIQTGQVNPWPDGTVLAKAAWAQQPDTTGLIRPGEFVQVEFMIKDTKKYASTKGWGWARWKGTDLNPYGQDALFTTECISCHRPWKDKDYVFTLPLTFHSKK